MPAAGMGMAGKRKAKSTAGGKRMCPNPNYVKPAPLKVPAAKPKRKPRIRLMPDQYGLEA